MCSQTNPGPYQGLKPWWQVSGVSMLQACNLLLHQFPTSSLKKLVIDANLVVVLQPWYLKIPSQGIL